jgi:hypothetical protein
MIVQSIEYWKIWYEGVVRYRYLEKICKRGVFTIKILYAKILQLFDWTIDEKMCLETHYSLVQTCGHAICLAEPVPPPPPRAQYICNWAGVM